MRGTITQTEIYLDSHICILYTRSIISTLTRHKYRGCIWVLVARISLMRPKKQAALSVDQTRSRVSPPLVPPTSVSGSAALLQVARTHPTHLSPTHILQLQQMVGNRVVGQLLAASPPPTSVNNSTVQPPVLQRLAKDAVNYIKRKQLDIPTRGGRVKHAAVKKYIEDPTNPSIHRLGLARAWNKDGKIEGHIEVKQNHPIPVPTDAFPQGKKMKALEDLSGWDSEEEDDLNLSKVIGKKSKGQVTLVRTNGDEISAHLLSMMDVIRLGRQIVKRDSYDLLPFVSKVGPLYIEYNSPGTKDIYATPLEKIPGDSKKFKRAGEMAKYNYRNLTARLEEEPPVPVGNKRKRSSLTEQRQAKRQKMEGILKPFSGESEGELSEAQAETVAAISCDFMKGSGAMNFVEQAQRHIGEIQSDFAPFFRRVDPHYVPAQKGGRKMVTDFTTSTRTLRKEVKPLLRQRNNLVHAIARAHHGRMPTPWGWVRIRKQVRTPTALLEPSVTTMKAITEELEVKQNVIVHYPLRLKRKRQTFGNHSGKALNIYHVQGDEFTDTCPDKRQYFKKTSTKPVKNPIEEEEEEGD